MPLLQEATSPKLSARDELRECRSGPTGLVRPRRQEKRPDIENTESDEELERMMARPESQFIGHSLRDEAEMGYLGPEDNVLALPDGSKIESSGPALTRITREPHNEEQFQQRKNAIFAAIDKIESERKSYSKGNFCLVGKMPENTSLEMDIEVKEEKEKVQFQVPEPRIRKKKWNKRSMPQRQPKPQVADHIAHPENYTKYSLDWGRREQPGEQAQAVRQMQELLRQRRDKGIAQGHHEATPQSVGSLAAMAKSRMSSESVGSRQERLSKRRAYKHKKAGKGPISSKEIKKQTCTLSFEDD